MMVCFCEFFTRKDPVADLILICVKYIFNFYDKKERIRILAMVYDVYENYNSPPGVPFGYGKDDYDIKDCEDFLAIQADSPESRLLLEKIAHACEFSLWDIAREPFMDTNSIINPAKITTDLVVRKTVAYAFSKAAAESMTLTLVLRKKLNKSGARVALAFFYYGLVQEAAMAARKLKMLNPDYYHILYNNKLEMFFFLIESYLPPEIYHP